MRYSGRPAGRERVGARFCGRYHGFVYSSGKYITLDYPSGVHTFAYGINATGQIVGSFEDSNGYHGFLDKNGVFTDLYELLPTLTTAIASQAMPKTVSDLCTERNVGRNQMRVHGSCQPFTILVFVHLFRISACCTIFDGALRMQARVSMRQCT